MKKSWLFQLFALLIYYFDSMIDVSHEGIEFNPYPGLAFVFLLFHTTLFLWVNMVLIPQLFYKKRVLLFIISLFASIVLYGIMEEGIVEKVLDPHGRGNNPTTWQSIYWFFGEILLPLLIFMSVKFVFDYFEHQKKLEQIEKDSLQNELKFLKSQIQPHILFNSLNNLYDYTLSKSDKAPELVLQLSNVLRYVLYETSGEQVALSKELQFVKDYIALQEMQLEGRGEIVFSIEENADTDALKIAPFLLIPFVENSFKHSLSSQNRGIQIDIKIVIHANNLSLFVQNNFDPSSPISEDLTTKGVGLPNVQKRLELLYPDQNKLQIDVSDDLYTVQLDLNFS
ncbi:MAG: sensor histidine kinase [Chitinophagales bacterium]